jgi:hypothetical protein
MSTTVFCLACALLAYAGFCRLVHMDQATMWPIRLVFWALTVAAMVGFCAVLIWGHRPIWPSAGLAAAMAAVQLATSRSWTSGVPQPYRRPDA